MSGLQLTVRRKLRRRGARPHLERGDPPGVDQQRVRQVLAAVGVLWAQRESEVPSASFNLGRAAGVRRALAQPSAARVSLSGGTTPKLKWLAGLLRSGDNTTENEPPGATHILSARFELRQRSQSALARAGSMQGTGQLKRRNAREAG